MSLTIAFKVAQKGIVQSENKMSVIAANIGNANLEGYTRKIYRSANVTSNSVTSPVGGDVMQASVDAALSKRVNNESSISARDQTASRYWTDYSNAYGSTSQNATTLSGSVDELTTALQSLRENSSEISAKTILISKAQQLTLEFNNLTQSIQKQRLEANNEIATNIGEANDSLKTIGFLNLKINQALASGENAADLNDQRNLALETLVKHMGVQYFTDDNQQMKVFTKAGDLLVSGTYAVALAYDPVGVVTSTTLYPGGFNPIDLNGVDITTRIKTGTIGALIHLRDTDLVGEQEKLDGLAAKLASTINEIMNSGSSAPPRNSLTGSLSTTLATAFSGTGNWRVAVTDQSGTVQAFSDLNLSTYATVGALVTALNGIAGMSAALNADGQLVLTATSSTQGVSLNEMTSDVGGQGASSFFGLNNFFDGSIGNPITAANIKVSDYLVADPAAISSGRLNNSGALAVGDRGVTTGDISVITAIISAMETAQSFPAAGNFPSRNATLSNYANAILASAATQATSAANVADTSQATYTYLNDRLVNKVGVNIDEETANMTQLQSHYQANAAVLKTVRDLFQTLFDAVRG